MRPFHIEHLPSSARNARPDNEDPSVLVMHYTAGPMWRALDLLAGSDARVSSHYLVPEAAGPVYQLVPESERAWHAGVSCWQGQGDVNSRSIGIENVGWGYTYGPMPPMPPCPRLRRPVEMTVGMARRGAERLRALGMPVPARQWAPFPASQMSLLEALSLQIVERWQIRPECVVGHGDIAPGRKVDPGPAFPWERLAAKGVGDWPLETDAPLRLQAPSTESVPWAQHQLAQWGYPIPLNGKLDEATRDVLVAFQMHYRPSKHDGVLDLDCMRRLQLLRHRQLCRQT